MGIHILETEVFKFNFSNLLTETKAAYFVETCVVYVS